MTRRLGMTASPHLMSSLAALHGHSPRWGKWHTRAVVLALAVGALITAAVFTAGVTKAQMFCTPSVPYPPYNGVCTGGYGNFCTLGVVCSPVPGTPGTLNPDGYTPVCDSGKCPW